ncbi:hypothetical protein S245_048793, partial [Arachis hypogaea]
GFRGFHLRFVVAHLFFTVAIHHRAHQVSILCLVLFFSLILLLALSHSPSLCSVKKTVCSLATSSLLYCEASRFPMRQSIDPLQASIIIEAQHLEKNLSRLGICGYKLQASIKLDLCIASNYRDMMFGCEKHAAPHCRVPHIFA